MWRHAYARKITQATHPATTATLPISSMVKSKVLKQLRKQVEKAEKHQGILDTIEIPQFDGLDFEYKKDALGESDLAACLTLFENNMGDMYRGSSWGLDMDEKKKEITHRSARFLLLKSSSELAAFLHFRLCFDDDQEPSRAVTYVYEIQIDDAYRRQGLGVKLMKIVEEIAKVVQLPAVVLTVFKSNQPALQFYTEKLDYSTDEISPSNFGEDADYEILSKVLE